MTEKTSGLYRLVTIPQVYEMIQNGLGGVSARRSFKEEYFPDVAGKRVLEVGCGPGTWFPEISECAEYLGMDWNAQHIVEANKKFGSDIVRFVNGDVSKDVPQEGDGYDFIFAFGILHHLNDEQVTSLLQVCEKLVSKQGKFISVDPVYHDGQNFFAKWMNDRDSGQDIRTENAYASLVSRAFGNVETSICTDKLRIPYSHCVIVAK